MDAILKRGALALIAAGFLAAGAAAPAQALPAVMAPPAGETDVMRTGGNHHHHHHGRFYRPSFGLYIAPPVYYAPSGCGWLRVRAIETGSRYWWRRYRACLD
jgi:hypothetical protein